MKKSLLTIFLLILSIASAQEKKWTLAECVDYALKNNITIKQTELDTVLARIDKRGAFGSFLPTANASASHSWNIGRSQNPITFALETETTQFTSTSLNAGIDIFNGLQAQNRYRRSKMAIIAAQYQLSKIKYDVELNVANAFLQILFNKENLKVQREQLANNNKQIQRTQELVSAGSIPRGDLLDMRATVAVSEVAVINAENALLISKLSLAQLLQLKDFQNFDIADEDYIMAESETMAQTPEAILAKAKETRVELKIARTNLEIAERDVKIARGALQPNLRGFYSFSTSATYNDRVVGVDANNNPIFAGPLPVLDQFSDNKGHQFGVQLSIPILNGFAASNNVSRAKVGLDRSKIAYSQQELDLERNVYTAFTDAKGALNAYQSAQVALEARQEAFNYAKEKYAVGIMNAFDYNQAQTLLVNAQSDLIRAKYDYMFRVKVVEFYFGIPITQLK